MGIVSASYPRHIRAVSVPVLGIVSKSYPHHNRAVSVPVLGIISASFPRRNRAVSVPVLGIVICHTSPYPKSLMEALSHKRYSTIMMRRWVGVWVGGGGVGVGLVSVQYLNFE